MLPFETVGMNFSLCTQLSSGTALRHSKEMRINMLQDGHVLTYCDNKVSEILRRNKHSDKTKHKFMGNVEKTFPSEYIILI